MIMSKSKLKTFAAAVALFASASAALATDLPKVVTSGHNPEDVRAIQLANEKWDRDVATRNLDGLIASYADKGRAFPSGKPPVVGKEALRAYWGALLSLPGFHFDTTDTHVVVAQSGDQAWISGDYVLSFQSPQGKVEDVGKYVLVYEKIDGTWKLVLDIDNSNGRG